MAKENPGVFRGMVDVVASLDAAAQEPLLLLKEHLRQHRMNSLSADFKLFQLFFKLQAISMW